MALAVAAGGILLVVPFLSLVLTAASGSEALGHVAVHVLPAAAFETIALLIGVGIVVATMGTGSAWLVSAFDFPGRRFAEAALVLPLAVPTYVAAYSFLDLLHPVGPVQTTLRGWLGLTDPRALPFPDLRSLPGCALLFGLVLYPYVYLPVRAAFLMGGANVLDAARTLGAGRWRRLRLVALPLARPAIAIGTALALLETLNDVGASELLGVRTLTVSIYATWVNRSDLPGAAQIALALLALVGLLLWLEAHARRSAGYAATGRPPSRRRLSGPAGAATLALLLVPVAIGFGAPALHLALAAARRVGFAGLSPELGRELLNSLALAGTATLVTVVAGVAIAGRARMQPGPVGRALARLAALGYGVPGTVLAVAILPVVALADTALAALVQSATGVRPGILLLGSSLALVYAYSVRFLAIPSGAASAGLGKVPASLDAAGRVLGRSPVATFRLVHLPLIRPAVFAGGLLVFVDALKELPATLLLRPLNVETLATRLYGEAARGTYEEGAVAALLIVAAGTLPLLLLPRSETAR